MVKKLRLNLHTQTNITKWLWLNKKNESPNEGCMGDSFFNCNQPLLNTFYKIIFEF